MSRVLVTGASGFVGRWALGPLCARGVDVHTVQRHPDVRASAGMTNHTLDLHDRDAVDDLMRQIRPTHLLHFAWVTTPRAYLTSLENLAWVHTTLQVVESFLRHGGSRVVVVGTGAEYDWTSPVCSEHSTPCRPATLYGASKHAVYEVLDRWSAQEGFSFAHGRLFWMYGPGENHERLVPAMVRASAAGTPFRLQFPQQVRDYLHVSDAGAAFAALIAGDVQGAVNVGSGEGVSLERLGELVGLETGRGLTLEQAPDGGIDTFPAVVADVSRLTHEVGWTPRYRVDEGIRETVAWWKTQGREMQA